MHIFWCSSELIGCFFLSGSLATGPVKADTIEEEPENEEEEPPPETDIQP